MTSSGQRIIGIAHRRKAGKSQKAQPTRICILGVKKNAILLCKSMTDERDFRFGKFPVKHRRLDKDESVELYNKTSCRNGVRPHQCKWKVAKPDQTAEIMPAGRVQMLPDKKNIPKAHVLTHVPTDFEGLKSGDRVAMIIGGSGGLYAAALSRRGEVIKDAQVLRLAPHALKTERDRVNGEKDDDHILLATMLEKALQADSGTGFFNVVQPRDRDTILVRQRFFMRQNVMADRIACGQRIGEALETRISFEVDSDYPEATLEESLREELANDVIYGNLFADEHRRDVDLERAIKQHTVWDTVFAGITGVGPRIAAGLIVAIGDIGRFWVEPDPEVMRQSAERQQEFERTGCLEKIRAEVTANAKDMVGPQNWDGDRLRHFELLKRAVQWMKTAERQQDAADLAEALTCLRQRSKLRRNARNRGMFKLRRFCGAYVRNGGEFGKVPRELQFPRKRRGGAGSKHNRLARQALYLIVDQANRRPSSHWGQVFLSCKEHYRRQHPNPIDNNGTMRYTDGHIHNMATWRMAQKFVDHLFKEWTKLEKAAIAADVKA